MATSHSIALGNTDGWLFKQGNDTGWAKKDISITGWKKIKPSELSGKFADKNGRLEGWLRIKIKLDTAFRDTVLGLYMNSWAASEVYLDGNLLNTYGNTGTNGEPFKEFSPIYQFPVPFKIEKNNKHTISCTFCGFCFSASALPFKIRRRASLFRFNNQS